MPLVLATSSMPPTLVTHSAKLPTEIASLAATRNAREYAEARRRSALNTYFTIRVSTGVLVCTLMPRPSRLALIPSKTTFSAELPLIS